MMIADEQFETDFREVLEDVLGWDVQVTDDDGPGTVEGWDSLAHIRIVHALEARFGVRLSDDAVLERQSVASLKQLVLNGASAA